MLKWKILLKLSKILKILIFNVLFYTQYSGINFLFDFDFQYIGISIALSIPLSVFITYKFSKFCNKIKLLSSDYRYFILALLAEMIKADGKQDENELKTVEETISRYYSEVDRILAFELFKSLLKDKSTDTSDRINEFCDKINEKFKSNYAAKSELIMELLAMAYADHELYENENYIIQCVVQYLNISNDKYNSIKKIFILKYKQGFYNSDYSEESADEYPQMDESNYKYCILILLAEVIKADKTASEIELNSAETLIKYYYKKETQKKAALYHLRNLIYYDKKNNVEKACRTINLNLNIKRKKKLLLHLLELAYVNNDIHIHENSVIKSIARNLKISLSEYEDIFKIFKIERDAYNEESNNHSKYDDKEDINFCVLVLLSEVMKADKDLLKCELDVIKTVIRNYYKTEQEQKAALKQLQIIVNNKFDVNQYYDLNKIYKIINKHLGYADKLDIVENLFSIIYADNIQTIDEFNIIYDIVFNLKISKVDFGKLRYQFTKEQNKKYSEQSSQSNNETNSNNGSGQNNNKTNSNNGSGQNNNKTNSDNGSGQNNSETNSNNSKSESSNNRKYRQRLSVSQACDILGVVGDASNEEIKKAYKALAIKYHPDLVSSLGDEAVRQATETMTQINIAWDVIKMSRGIN